MAHQRQNIPLSDRNIKAYEALRDIDQEPLVEAGGSYSAKVAFVTYLFIDSKRISGAFEIVAVSFAGDHNNPVIAAYLASATTRKFRVYVFFEGSLSDAYDLIPGDE